jgi:hypothetical protein
MKSKLLLTVLFSIGIITFASAQTRDRGRIREGVRHGEITRHESARLRHQRHEMRRDHRRAKADGVISRRERKELRRDKMKHNRSIYRFKHNNRDRRFS